MGPTTVTSGYPAVKYVILVAALLGTTLSPKLPAAETQTPGRVLHWTTDVRPAFESVICVSLAEFGGKSVFAASIAEPQGCPGPLPSESLLAQAARLLGTRGALMRAKVGDPSKAFEGIPADAAHVSAATQSYRTMVLSHPEAQRRLMPRLHQLLAAAGATCPDCPGPKEFPVSRSVRYSELVPYVLAYLWPVNVEADGAFSLQTCSGINGIQEIRAPDPTLVYAGFDLVFGNSAAQSATIRRLREATGSPECKKLDSPGRLAYVRKRLAEVLPGDASFQEALRPGIHYLPEIGLVCSDCS